MIDREREKESAKNVVSAVAAARTSIGQEGQCSSLLGGAGVLSDIGLPWGGILGADSLSKAVYLAAKELWAQDGHEILALELFNSAANLGVETAWLDFAECLLWLGERQEARVTLRKLAQRRGSIGREADALIISAALEDGETIDANLAIRKLRAGAQGRPYLRLQLGKLLLETGNEEEALSLLAELGAEGDAEASITLGNYLWDHKGDRAGAEEAYLVGARSGDAHCWYNLGQLQIVGDRLPEGLHSLQRAASLGDAAAVERLRELED